MSWVSFEAVVETLEWGRATYTILRLPPEAEAALGGARRVEGEVGDHPVNLAVTRAPVVEGAFLWAGKSFLRDVGARPGEPLDVRLRPADPRDVQTPEDVAAALRAAGRTAAWEALSAGRRRGLLHGVASAVAPATRARRVAALVAGLA